MLETFPLGDTALLCKAFEAPPPNGWPAGVTDLVPAFGWVAIHFDPLRIDSKHVSDWLKKLPPPSPARGESRAPVELPVLYGGDEGPDLAEVAEHRGLSTDEVIERHQASPCAVGAVGFQPGFAYLEGLDPSLHTPRRESPRTRVPAGSVAIGGPYTGVYPRESPGGWRLIGRTPLAMFDPTRDPASLLSHADRVRFRPIDRKEFDLLAGETSTSPSPAAPNDRPVLRIIDPGAYATLQGLGQPGLQEIGVSPGGAMDPLSLRLSNALVGGPNGAASLETTLVGPVLEALVDLVIGVAGAVPKALGGPRRVALARGQRIDLRAMSGGSRLYVAIEEGFATDLTPGRDHPPIRKNDLLHAASGVPFVTSQVSSRWSVANLVDAAPPATLRVMRDHSHALLERTAWNDFLAGDYRVASQSSRMGVRCEGPAIAVAAAGHAASRPVCWGSIQVPPDGQPIVLGSDRQTLGGYPVVGHVISADWPRLGQLRPGERVCFEEVDLPAAQRRRREEEAQLGLALQGIAAHLSGRGPT